jgi:DNA end-binding protein Ku
MAARPTWKGFLKVSLVNIPVKVFPATESAASISFNQLHAECQTRIQQKRWCPHCDKEVPHSDIVKGYEFEKGRYVVINDEDIQKVRVESTRVIDLAQFTDETAIDPIYVDRSYYLAPDGGMATDAFAVMREGMAGKVGIGKVALYGREYLVAVRPQKKGLVMYTLHHDAEIRSIDEIDELNSVPSKVKPEEMKLAKQVVATFDAELNLKDYKDEYKEGLRQIIEAKIAGEEVIAPEIQEPPKVVDLMEALRRSLDAVSTEKKKPVKADLATAASKTKAAAAAPKAVASAAKKRRAG